MLVLFRLLEGDRGRETALHDCSAVQPDDITLASGVNRRLDAALPTYRHPYTETRCSK